MQKRFALRILSAHKIQNVFKEHEHFHTYPDFTGLHNKVLSYTQIYELDLITRKKSKLNRDRDDKHSGTYRSWHRTSSLSSIKQASDKSAHTNPH